MQFSSAIIVAAAAASASAMSNSTHTSFSTATDISKTTLTVTHCEDMVCTELPVVTGLTTVTLNETIYTTYCPLTSEAPVSVVSSVAPVSAKASSSAVHSAAKNETSSIVPQNGANGLAASGVAAALVAGLSFLL